MRVGKSVWHASRKKILNAEIAEYDKPTEIITRFNFLTVMPAVSRGYMEVMQYGEKISNYWTMIANAKYFYGKFKEGDLMWVDGESPIESVEKEYGYGASANAVIKSVAEVNHTISITLEKNQNRVIE